MIEIVMVEDFPRFRHTSEFHQKKKLGGTVLRDFKCKSGIFARGNGHDMNYLLGRREVRQRHGELNRLV